MKIKTTYQIHFDFSKDVELGYAPRINKEKNKKWVAVDDLYFELDKLTKGTKVNMGALLDLMTKLSPVIKEE